jgi:hypothetical protein
MLLSYHQLCPIVARQSYASHLQGFSRKNPGFWLKISKIVNQIRCKSGIFEEFCKMSRFFAVFEEILMTSLAKVDKIVWLP